MNDEQHECHAHGRAMSDQDFDNMNSRSTIKTSRICTKITRLSLETTTDTMSLKIEKRNKPKLRTWAKHPSTDLTARQT